MLNAAYNDAQGVTADFNLNMLIRINRELGGNFKLDSFEHHAFYNRERHRVEMHLASLKRQKVKVAGETFEFRAGETIHTENSYKYSAGVARRAGARRRLDAGGGVDRRAQVFLHPGVHAGRRAVEARPEPAFAMCLPALRLAVPAPARAGVFMKIVAFEANNNLHLGVVEGDSVVDLQAVECQCARRSRRILRRNNGDLAPLADLAKKAPASARRPLAGLKFALPVARPGKIICLGLNYLDHVKEGPQRDNIPKFQSIFFRMLSSLTPHLQPLMRPRKSIQFDYEGEMVVVIGKRAKHLTLENAVDCVAGYACGMEGSIREYQRHTTQWGMGKNFDRTGSVGPWMVSADELPRGGKGLKIMSRLNGNVMQSSNTEHFMFPVAESLVYLTEGMTLEPGDILFTGTPSGVGHARKPEPVWMKAGDTVEVEVEGVGDVAQSDRGRKGKGGLRWPSN